MEKDALDEDDILTIIKTAESDRSSLIEDDKDDLNIDLDILAIFNIINDNEKRTKLEECLKDSPSSPEELISKLLEEMTHIHNELISDK